MVSLPQGVFNPYSGVKTSILVMDKSLARRANQIAFFRVAHDGYDLGAQRRPVPENNLPAALYDITEYLRRMRTGEPLEEFRPATGLVVDKKRIGEDGEYNLSGERYRDDGLAISDWPVVEIGRIFQSRKEAVVPRTLKGLITYVGLENITQNTGQLTGQVLVDDPSEIKSAKNVFCNDDILYGRLRPNLNKVWLADRQGICSTDIIVLRPSNGNALPALYARILRGAALNAAVMQRVSGAQLPRISWGQFEELQVPLPPLDVQREIVAEIEGYQRVMDGARMVIENYRPHIAVDPEWPMVEIGECCEVKSGGTPKRSVEAFWGGDIPWVGSGTCKNDLVNQPDEFITQEGLTNSSAKLFPKHTTLVALVGATIGKTGYLAFDCTTNQNVAGLFPKNPDILNPTYLFYAAQMLYPEFLKLGQRDFRMANLSFVRKLAIPLPPPITQSCIVSEIEAEQSLVTANLELVNRMEAKIDAAIGRVWETNSKA